MKLKFLLSILLAVSAEVQAQACLIESDDDHEPIRLCQENLTIPQNLFETSFCHPDIPERSFRIESVDKCPTGYYGICEGARAQGVGYQQSIHYYSNANDAPVLKAYCEQISQGKWVEPAAR